MSSSSYFPGLRLFGWVVDSACAAATQASAGSGGAAIMCF